MEENKPKLVPIHLYELVELPNDPNTKALQKDGLIVNFWRALSAEPENLAKVADYPVTETDLHARHRWLIKNIDKEFYQKLEEDPYFYNLKIAGWWIWGMGASIGDNWLRPKGLNSLPLLSSAGGGVHGLSLPILDWFQALQKRTRRVRIACGDWKRIVTPSITFKNNGLGKDDITGVFLDPPYDFSGRDKVYKEDHNIYKEVCEWAVNNGEQDKLRIIVCGYDGSFKFPDSWQEYAWQANGGMANLGDAIGKENSNKERIYFSPNCLK